MHSNLVCPKYNEPVLPDVNGMCSLCGADINVISVYSLQEALEDGVLVKVFDAHTEKFMRRYVDNKPIVATAHLLSELQGFELLEIWNRFIVWRREVMPTLPEEDRLFSLVLNGQEVWVDETSEAITFMHPEDY